MADENQGTGQPQGQAPGRPGDYSAPGVNEGTQPQPPGTTPPIPPAGGAAGWTPPAQGQPGAVGPTQAPPGWSGGTTGGMAAGPVPPPPGGGRQKGGWGRTVVTALVAGLIGAIIVLLVFPAAFGVNPYDLVRGKVKSAETHEEISLPKSTTKVVSPSGPTDVSAIAQKVIPSIVNIDVSQTVQSVPGLSSGVQQGTGSGVIYTSGGYILTNNHVVGSATKITVTLASGEKLAGTRVGTDPESDIAVVKIDKSGLPAITLGNSDTLVVGELAVAIGSPFGFEQSVTSGIISALNRNVTAQDESGNPVLLTNLIQTDAAINPGNSGGALCDSDSRLIGINTLIASSSGGSEGIGFATPSNTAKRVADDLIAGKPVSHPYIGISGQTVSDTIATQYNLPVTSGAYVTAVVPGSPAEKAGIKQGDIIVSVNGQAVTSMDDLIGAVRNNNVGQTITLGYYSNGQKKSAQVTLAEMPSNVQ